MVYFFFLRNSKGYMIQMITIVQYVYRSLLGSISIIQVILGWIYNIGGLEWWKNVITYKKIPNFYFVTSMIDGQNILKIRHCQRFSGLFRGNIQNKIPDHRVLDYFFPNNNNNNKSDLLGFHQIFFFVFFLHLISPLAIIMIHFLFSTYTGKKIFEK